MKGLRVLLLILCAALAAFATAGARPASGAAPEFSRLEVIRASHHASFDRVVFEFAGAVPPREVGYVETQIGDPSGLPIALPGRAVLQVTLRDTEAHDELGDRASRRNTFASRAYN